MARASLQFIMGVDGDDDRPGSSHNGDKRDRVPAGTPASASHPGSRPSDPTHHPSYATSPGQQNDINPSSDTSGPGPRRSRSSRPSRSTTASSSSSRPTNSRRRSTASLESAEQAGYASSSSVGGSGGGPTMTSSNYPSRPMHHTAPGESPVKLTPITGRVSRAKKGVPVHTCDQCRPPKVFTRAEHLRRHQLSHQTPAHACTYPGCDRAFHRQDLLTRHLQKHAQEGDKASGRGGQRPREPSQTLPEQPQTLQSTQPPLDPMSQMSVAAYTTAAPSYMNNSGAYTPSMRDSGRAAGTPSSSHEPSAGGYGSPSSDQNQPSYGGYAPNFRYTSSSPASSSAGGQMINQMTPRTPAVPLVLITQGLDAHMQLDNPPDLVHTIPDISPWASSTDSSYSTTPATDNSRQLRHAWIPNHASPMGDWQHQSFLGYSPSTGPDPGAMDPLASSTSYLFSPSDITPQPHALSQTSNFDYLDVPVGGARSMTVNSPRFQDPSVSSVRSPSPITTTTMSAETLVAPSLALPIGRSGMPAGLGRQKVLAVDASANAYDTFQGIGGAMGFTVGSTGSFTELNGMGGGGCAASAVPISPLPRTIRNAIPNYINVYWNRFHIIYPVVHRASFEAAPEAVLSYAMAAVATQFLDSKEDRLRGNLLHEHAWQEAKCCSAWTTQTMQAIILCEFFARFRGRKVVTRPSKMFESLYSRVLDQNNTLFDEASFEDGLPIANEERWHTWIEAEVRRRLLSMCFFLDNHTSKYQEQPLLRGFDLLQAGPTPPIPMASTSAALWGAPSADSWAAMLRADPLAGKPGFLPHPDVLSPSSIQALPIFDRAVILAFESLRLPRRTVMGKDSAASSGAASASNTPEGQWPDDTESMADNSDVEDRISYLFGGCPIANTYLALNHTPLHDLLAVSGDTWIFSQKILPATSFLEHKKRLKIWAEGRAQQRSAGSTSMSVAKAVGFAARALVAFLERDSDETLSDGGQNGWLYDLSEYWAVYVCSLICWAYGRRYPGRCDDGDASENEAVGWLRRVAGTRADELPRATRESSRRAAGGVVKMIRRRLEVECVEGARSRLFVDAVGVLKKLEEGANWRWF